MIKRREFITLIEGAALVSFPATDTPRKECCMLRRGMLILLVGGCGDAVATRIVSQFRLPILDRHLHAGEDAAGDHREIPPRSGEDEAVSECERAEARSCGKASLDSIAP
jgi:hypothetical protein